MNNFELRWTLHIANQRSVHCSRQFAVLLLLPLLLLLQAETAPHLAPVIDLNCVTLSFCCLLRRFCKQNNEHMRSCT